MENQERKGVQEVTTNLMDDVVKEKLQSFSVLSARKEGVNSVNGVIVGNPVDLISSLVVIMRQNSQVHSLLKTAVDAFEQLKEIRSPSPDQNRRSVFEEFVNELFRKTYNS